MKIFIKNMLKSFRLYCILATLALIIVLVVIYKHSNNDIIISYKEYPNVDYKVFLLRNNFFDDQYLPSNKQYISDLADYVLFSGSINYNFSKKVKLEYDNKYFIKVQVKNNSTEKNIYELEQNICEEEAADIDIKGRVVSVPISCKIDYAEFNSVVKQLIEAYELKNIKSTIKFDIITNIKAAFFGYKKVYKKELKTSYTLSLGENTFEINGEANSLDTDNQFFVLSKSSKYNGFLRFSIISLIGILFIINRALIIKAFIIIKNYFVTRLNKNGDYKQILKKYSDQIITVETCRLNDYRNKISVKSIEDLLEIKELLNKPLLLNNSKKEIKLFVIDTDKIYYLIIPSTE